MLIDSATIALKAGDGGNGCVSFRREKYVPRGGPNGGDGGRGGNVLFEASEGRSTLLDFRYRRRYSAPNGRPGSGADRHGRSGDDIVLKVPVGTVVRDHETGDVLADLDAAGSRVLAARGGRGGRGNARFATPTEQAPRHAEPGEPGQERTVDLELKLLADVGVVGLPNAGKSTLLSRMSAARPRIGDYPFTTLSPVLGLVREGLGESFVMADLPGLVEGAHAGKGLGHRFLRHVERTRVLVMLLDVTAEPEAAYRTLLSELSRFGQGLDEKPRVVVLSKIDLVPGVVRRPDFGGELVLAVSAVAGTGLDELRHTLARALREARSKDARGAGPRPRRPPGGTGPPTSPERNVT